MPYLKTLLGKIRSAFVAVRTRFPFIARKRFYLPVAAVLLIVLVVTLLHKPAAPAFESGTVTRGNIEKVVSETGTVEPAQEVDLAFTSTGRITKVYVDEGQTVRQSQLLASVDSSRAVADLQSAKARLAEIEASSKQSGMTREQTQAQQDQLVANAQRALVSGDLEAYLTSGSTEGSGRDFTAPTITGTYSCTGEGTYHLELYSSAAQSGSSFRYSGLETGIGTVSTVGPMPLGHCGLYIQFPSSYAGSAEWNIPVPNVRSSTYVSRKNAYEAAVEARSLALSQTAQDPVLAAQIAQAQAAVAAAQAVVADTRLLAPFSGTVTKVQAVTGALASPGAPALSLISNQSFEIDVDVSEDDIGDVNVGDVADVTFDAYKDVTMPARVSFISPSATTDSGGAVFTVKLLFTKPDERIRAGLSADVDIHAAEADDVIAVPTRAIVEENGTKYVRILTSDTTYRKVPITGGLSGDGMTEVKTGLAEGDRIITFANGTALSGLTEQK